VGAAATVDQVLRLRLRRQLVDAPASAGAGAPGGTSPADVVARLTAMQAQDYLGALWSIGLRCSPETTEAAVEAAIAHRLIIRTWPMRGTLHFVAPQDVRWMLALLAPRVIARSAGRYAQLGLTDGDFARSRELLAEALAGGTALTRADAIARLESGGIDTAGQRGYHILGRLAQEGLLCLGPMRGRQQTFVLLDEWVPPTGDATALSRDDALGRLAARYFDAHGPATLADFAWWAGITKADARTDIGAASPAPETVTIGGAEYWLTRNASAGTALGPEPSAPTVRLLPGFDEFMLGYTDRSLQLGEHRDTYGSAVSANGAFSSTIVVDGRIVGTWKRVLKPGRVEISTRPFRELSGPERRGLAEAAERYGRFLGREVVIA
jgi:hypothetical protein